MAAAVPPPRPAVSPPGALMKPGPQVARIAALGLLTAAIFLAYVPAVVAGLGFVSDDFMILQRVRDAGGLTGAASFFGQSYYDYYRPLGFVSFAADWTLWRNWPAAYHATSILLHLLNAILVFLLARRLVEEQTAAVAAAIFGLHVVNQEAVFWVSARFDLLATAGALAVLVLIGWRWKWKYAGAALLYLAALLAKESVVALPIAAGAYLWLISREKTPVLMRAFAWLGAAAVAYVLLRQTSGLAGTGGASRLPKLAALAVLLLVQLAAAHHSSASLRSWLWDRRHALSAGIVVALLAIGGLTVLSEPGSALRGAFGAFGFAALHLVSPISPVPWLNPLPAWLTIIGLAAAGALVLAAWRFAGREVLAFLGFLLAAAVLPVSSMTEGSRYLYLASVPVSIVAAWVLSTVSGRRTAAAYTLLAVVLVAFGWQVRATGRDWLWASDMTSRAVATIVRAAGPGCRGANVFLATAPVRVHGVYANINAEGLAALGDCRPASVTTLVRLGYDAPAVAAELTPGGLTMRIEPYSGGFVTSADLQKFSIQLGPGVQTVVHNPLGRFEAAPAGNTFVIRQAFAHPTDPQARWFVLSRGQLEFLPASSQATPAGQDRR